MHRTLARYESLPFIWGESDCCRFVGACVRETTGRDLLAGFEWHDETSAAELVRAHGSLLDICLHELGPSKAGAEDGDIVLAHVMGKEMLGVVHEGRCVMRSERGLVRLPISRAVYAWRP